jgi:D-alanyl-D-alanine carboxypeptidase
MEGRVSPETRFELASITKQFTAAGILLLAEEGKVDLDASITHYLPDAPAAWQPITVRHLLTHTSGLPPLGEGFTGMGIWPLNVSTDRMYDAARADTLRFRPGDRFLYSDVGYFLLGVITQRASGMPWREFMQRRIFEPLAMTDTYIVAQSLIHKNEARGYTLRNGELINIRRVRQIETPSHYGIFSNVGDLVKWDAALSTDRLLSEKSRTEMQTPARLNDVSSHPYGFGWRVWNQRGHAIQLHTGVTGTEIIRLPDDTLMVVVLTNLGRGTGGTADSWGIAQEIAGMVVPGLMRPPLVETAIDGEAIRAFTGEFVNDAGRTIQLSIQDGRLTFVFGDGQEPGALVYQGGVTFELADQDRRIVFNIGDQGEATGFAVTGPGSDVPQVRFVRVRE